MTPRSKKARPEKASTGRPRRPLSKHQVLRAALRLADREGIDALSMRRLGQKLGVEAMSLYHHVENKEALIDDLVDLVFGEIRRPEPGGDWRDQMRQRAHSAHEVLLHHPWAAALMVSRINIGPNALSYVDATIGCLLEAGFSFELADRAWNAIDSHVYGFTLQEQNFPFDEADYSSAAEQFLPQIPEDSLPHLHALTVEVMAGRHRGLQDFAFGLELLLEGLEKLRRKRRR